MLVPVIVLGRTAGLLYADGLGDESPPWSRIRRLAEAVGESLTGLLARR